MEFYYDVVHEDILVLSADGGLMQDNAHHFVGEIEKYIGLGVRKLIVDCSQLTRISSFGLGILVSLHKRMDKRGGDVKLAQVSGFVAKVIGMTGLGALFHMYPTVEEAREAFAGPDTAGAGESKHPHLDNS